MKQSDNPHVFSLELDRILDSTGKDIRDNEGNTIDVKDLVKLSDIPRSLAKKTTLGMDTTAYAWDGNQLKTATTPATTLADLTTMFDANGELNDLTATCFTENGVAVTVGEAIDNIAKAHGFEGSTDEFLKLAMEDPNNPGQYVKMSQLLNNAVKGGTPAFPLLDTTNTSVEMDGMVFDGIIVNYNADTGKFNGINVENPAQSTFMLNFSSLGIHITHLQLTGGHVSAVRSNIYADAIELARVQSSGIQIIAVLLQTGGIGKHSRRDLTQQLGHTAVICRVDHAVVLNGQTDHLSKSASGSQLVRRNVTLVGTYCGSSLLIIVGTLRHIHLDIGIGVDITADGGYMTTGQLEMSNVDLSSEFTEMITTQRGFQANSRIITVSDTLLEELTNLKR